MKRGQWILQQLLGTPPPPPPPEVAKLDESPQAADAASLRERMEVHRTNPQCASCHQQMDPLGFALENYDAVGRWRTMDGAFPIDPSGELIGGRKFADVQGVEDTPADRRPPRNSRGALIENMLTYGLGRGLEAYDYCTVEDIREQLERRRLPDSQHHLRNRGEPGVSESGRFPGEQGPLVWPLEPRVSKVGICVNLVSFGGR